MGRITGLGSDPQLLRSITVSANGQVLPNATVLPVGLPFTALMEQILKSGAAPTFGLTSDQEAGIVGAKTPLSASNVVATAAELTAAVAAIGVIDAAQTAAITANTNALGQQAAYEVYTAGTGGGQIVPVGSSNAATNYRSAVLAGESATAAGGYSIVIGGYIQNAKGNWTLIAGGRNNTMNGVEAYGIIAGSSYCTTNAAYCGIYNSSGCSIAAGCDYTTLLGCTNLAVTTGSHQTYINNVLYVPASKTNLTLASPDGTQTGILSISNTGALLFNGASVGGSSGPTITNPTFTAA